jgi:hypothetical protein
MSKTYRIHPAIGIARVGNSQGNQLNTHYFHGSEIPDVPGNPADGLYRDNLGALKRQAARFRVFEHDTDQPGAAKEIQVGGTVAGIEWTVHLANKKAFWFQFQGTSGENGYAANHPRRNADPDNRSKWIIDFGPRTVQQGETKRFDRGSGGGFPETGPTALTNGAPVKIDYLGELQCDGQGILTVLGAHGVAGALDDAAVEQFKTAADYANNPKWFDDTSDGPVTATIHFSDGTKISAEQAWVVVGPPDYAPPILNLVTMWDTLFDLAVRKFPGFAPTLFDSASNSFKATFEPAYTQDIYPILQRVARYRAVQSRAKGHHRWDNEAAFAALGKKPYQPPNIPGFRSPTQIFNIVRSPGSGGSGIDDGLMPKLFGDGGADSSLTLTPTQYFFLQQWKSGKFQNDWTGFPTPPNTITAGGLDRAALEGAVGGAFFPGIEATWIMRRAALYETPFNFRFKAQIADEMNLDGLTPGSLTMRSACPWQADFYECKEAWWPAARPDQVDRAGASAEWALGIDAATTPQSDYNMVLNWHALGIVKETSRGVFAEDERILSQPIA